MISEKPANAAGRREGFLHVLFMCAEKVITPASSCPFPDGKIAGNGGETPLGIPSLYREVS